MHLILPLASIACLLTAVAARTITFINKSNQVLTVTRHFGKFGRDGAEPVFENLQPNGQCTFQPTYGHHQFFANNAWKTQAMFHFDGQNDDEYSILAGGDFAMEITSSKGGAKVECLAARCAEDKRQVARGGDFTVTFLPPPPPEGKSNGALKKTGGV